MLSKETLIKINKQLEENGKMINESALDFAISAQKRTKNWLEQLSYLVRAILIDHVFSDGNKRTALALIIGAFEDLKLGYNPRKLEENLIAILKNNITDLKKIGRLLKDAIR